MNKDKLEAIERAVEKLGGKIPKPQVSYDGSGYYRDYYGERIFKTGAIDLCSTEDYKGVARKMGYINGYKYGVEYPTNGKKPDLPDDVVVAKIREGVFTAGLSEIFRPIQSERDKVIEAAKSEVMSAKSVFKLSREDEITLQSLHTAGMLTLPKGE